MNGLGPLATHMVQHMAVMNVVMPAAAFMLRAMTADTSLWRSWSLATASQIVLLWAWHNPLAFSAAAHAPLLMIAMHLSLAAAALWFWLSILSIPREGAWRALFALLVTGKLFCLLGALLLFSPRLVYPGLHLHDHAAGSAGIPDQQMAGILMLAACPASYIAAGITIAARWFLALEARGAARG